MGPSWEFCALVKIMDGMSMTQTGICIMGPNAVFYHNTIHNCVCKYNHF